MFSNSITIGFFKVLLVLLVILVILWLTGPRPKATFSLKPLALPENLDAYLDVSETAYPDIISGAEKTIYRPAGLEETTLSLVFIHGFSATRAELDPLCKMLADSLGANLFYTRLTGHGRTDPDAMAAGTVDAWMNDMTEALAIGRRLGEKVVVIGNSTGSTLAMYYAALFPDQQPAALVLISPNLGPNAALAELLTWPWAEQVLPLVLGPRRSFEPQNERQAKYWTTEYPVQPLFPMMALVKATRQAHLESITCPTHMIYSPNDQVIDPQKALAAYRRIGAPEKRATAIPRSGDTYSHLLAGDILSPETTEDVFLAMRDFLRDIPGRFPQ